MIKQIRLTATVAAGATGATATSKPFFGEILKVDMNVTGNSMDINLDTTAEQVAQAIIDYTGNTDTAFYPRASATNNAGTAKVYLSTDTAEVPIPFVVSGRVVLTLANAAAGETVTMGITYRE